MTLDEGIAEIEPVLRAAGFRRAATNHGRGSGGSYETAEFTRRNRRLRLWLRHGSLSVRYDLKGRELDHAAYMRALLGPAGGNRFPSYADDPRAAFLALRHDLEHHCDDFLRGTGKAYRRCVSLTARDAGNSGLARLGLTEQELGKR